MADRDAIVVSIIHIHLIHGYMAYSRMKDIDLIEIDKRLKKTYNPIFIVFTHLASFHDTRHFQQHVADAWNM